MDHTRVFNDIAAGRAAAHAKHGENSISARETVTPEDIIFWLGCMGEENGELLQTFTYDKDNSWPARRKELLDICCVATGWIEAIDRMLET